MIKLLKNAQVYAPAFLGKKDVLVVGDKICRIEDKITGYEGLPDVEVFDLATWPGKNCCPVILICMCISAAVAGNRAFLPACPLPV